MAEQAAGGDRLFKSIVAAKPKLVTGVPDGMLAQTIMLCEAAPDFPYIACAREEECIGVASGAAMAGERAVVMVQNAGLLNSLGALATMGIRYGLPFVVLVTNRGVLADPNSYDIEKCDGVRVPACKAMTPVFSYPMGRPAGRSDARRVPLGGGRAPAGGDRAGEVAGAEAQHERQRIFPRRKTRSPRRWRSTRRARLRCPTSARSRPG